MAFNSQYDGLNLTPAFTIPEDHSYGNDHSFMTSEDPLAQPRQPNLWTPQDMIAFLQAGPSRAPVEHEEGPVAEYASNSLSPAFDIWADMPAPYTTSQGPLNEISEGLGTGLESFQFGFSAEGGLAASPWDSTCIPAHISAPGGGNAMPSTSQATSEDALCENLPPPHTGDLQEWTGAPSVPLGVEEILHDTQIISPSSAVPLVPPSDLAGPSSSPVVHLPASVVTIASGETVAQRSRTQFLNAVACPSRSVPVVPRETTVEVEASTVTQLRRSGRKRPTTTTSYAEDAVHAPPPAKKRKVSGGKTAQPSPAPSTASTSGSAPGTKPVKQKRKPHRPRGEIDALLVPGSQDNECPAEGCTEMLNASRRTQNLAHLETHYSAGALHRPVKVRCLWCSVDKNLVPGNVMVDHVAQEHLQARYCCPYWNKEGVICQKTFKKPGYAYPHMLTVHKVPDWTSEFRSTLAGPTPQ